MSQERTIQNEVDCLHCGVVLIVECSASTGSPRQQDNGGFFSFECPACGAENHAVQLVGDAIQDRYPNPNVPRP